MYEDTASSADTQQGIRSFRCERLGGLMGFSKNWKQTRWLTAEVSLSSQDTGGTEGAPGPAKLELRRALAQRLTASFLDVAAPASQPRRLARACVCVCVCCAGQTNRIGVELLPHRALTVVMDSICKFCKPEKPGKDRELDPLFTDLRGRRRKRGAVNCSETTVFFTALCQAQHATV